MKRKLVEVLELFLYRPQVALRIWLLTNDDPNDIFGTRFLKTGVKINQANRRCAFFKNFCKGWEFICSNSFKINPFLLFGVQCFQLTQHKYVFG